VIETKNIRQNKKNKYITAKEWERGYRGGWERGYGS
jgi:hypothetical protein